MRAAVLTVSDGVSAGTREDRSGDLLEELLGGELDLVAFEPQGTLERVPDGAFVVDDQNAHGGSVLFQPESIVR